MILRRVLVGLTISLCVLGWARILWMARQPSPARHLHFFTPEGPADEGHFYTHRPLIADGDVVWIEGSKWENHNLILRVDFASRRADVLWELPKRAQPIFHVARHPSGDLVVCTGIGESEIYRLRAAGGVEKLGAFEEHMFSRGIAWVGDDVEVVLGNSIATRIRRFAGGQWTFRDVEPTPAGRKPLHVQLEQARHAGGEWRFIFSRSFADGKGVSLEMLETDANGRVSASTSRPLDLQATSIVVSPDLTLEYSYGDGRLWWQGRDRMRGQLAFSLSPDVAMGWSRGPREYVLARGDKLGPVLTRDRFIDNDSIIAPSSDGGFWVLGGFGRHVKAGANLERIDGMSFFERFANLFREFREYARWWEKASVPFVLWFLPLVLAVGWRRRSLPVALIPCLILAALLAKPFLELTAIF